MVSEGLSYLCLLIHRYETERGMRLTVEADLQGLSKVFDDLTLSKTDLEIQVEELNKDLVLLKKEHQEVKNKYISEVVLGMVERGEERRLGGGGNSEDDNKDVTPNFFS